MRLEKVIWMFPIALTLHNLEESIWLPAWSQHAGFWESPVGPAEFRVAAALLAILAYGVAYWSIRAGKQAIGTYAMTGFVFAMLLNMIYHVAATLGLHQYVPGVVTAGTLGDLAKSTAGIRRDSSSHSPSDPCSFLGRSVYLNFPD